MSEAQDDFKPRKILSVYQKVLTVVRYEELVEGGARGVQAEVVVDQYTRELPEA